METNAITVRRSPPADEVARTHSRRLLAGHTRQLLYAPLWALLLSGVWLIVAPRTPDLAGQLYRVQLFEHAGFTLWDDSWYGGHHIPGYSLLYPPLAALVGMRTLGVLAALASSILFERITVPLYGPKARLGTIFFAVGAVGDLWIGRITFALGVSFALAAVFMLMRARRDTTSGSAITGELGIAGELGAAICAALCAAASPVAGLMLALAAVSWGLAQRRLRVAIALVAPVLLVVLPLQMLFPEGGYEPFAMSSFLATVAVVLGFLWALPARERTLRVAGCLYLLCVLLCLIHTPMGSNVERYGVSLAGPLLLCALGRAGGLRASPRPAWALLAVLLGIAVWVVWGPVVQTERVQGDPSTSASFYVPVKRFFASHDGRLLRVEVPFTRSHWEAALLAPSVALARGWERQLDKRYDGVLESGHLTPGAYRGWLDSNGVSYVALPDLPLDPSSAQEGTLIRKGLPFLREVFVSRRWRVFKVLGASGLLEGPGKLESLGHAGFSLLARRPGHFLVRVHHTHWWTVTGGDAKVSSAPGGWTEVTVSRPGKVSVAARFSLGKALSLL